MQLMERALTDSDGEVQLAARGNDVLVRSPRATIYSRLTEGRFPRWRDVFPQRQDASKIELSVGPFYSAVRQAAIVTSEESRGVDFKFAGGTLRAFRPRRRSRPVASRTARSPTTAPRSRSASTPAMSATSSRCSTPKRPSRWRSKTPRAPPSAPPTTATATSSCPSPATANGQAFPLGEGPRCSGITGTTEPLPTLERHLMPPKPIADILAQLSPAVDMRANNRPPSSPTPGTKPSASPGTSSRSAGHSTAARSK